jgi:hypothetical protein
MIAIMTIDEPRPRGTSKHDGYRLVVQKAITRIMKAFSDRS